MIQGSAPDHEPPCVRTITNLTAQLRMLGHTPMQHRRPRRRRRNPQGQQAPASFLVEDMLVLHALQLSERTRRAGFPTDSDPPASAIHAGSSPIGTRVNFTAFRSCSAWVDSQNAHMLDIPAEFHQLDLTLRSRQSYPSPSIHITRHIIDTSTLSWRGRGAFNCSQSYLLAQHLASRPRLPYGPVL